MLCILEWMTSLRSPACPTAIIKTSWSTSSWERMSTWSALRGPPLQQELQAVLGLKQVGGGEREGPRLRRELSWEA